MNIIKLKIQPSCAKSEIVKKDGVIKIRLTAPPVDGRANKALVEFLSKTFKVPKTSIKIIKGETSREKLVEFGVDFEKISEFFEAL